MNHQLMLLLLSAFFISCFCNANPDSVGVYYEKIYKSELAIIDSNFQAAQELYTEAFQYKYPNGKDLYNAFLVSYYLNDSLFAKKYLQELAYKGFKKGIFKDTAWDHSFFKYVFANYDSCYSAGYNSKMRNYGAILKFIREQDQGIRKHAASGMPTGISQIYIDQIRAVDSINTEKLIVYIRKYGFPSFQQKGFWDGSSPNSFGTVWLVLWHCRPNPTNLDSFVKQAVLKGDFEPMDWATILTARRDSVKIDFHMKVWSDSLNLSESDIEKINTERSKIYLENLLDYRKKWRYAQQQDESSRTQYNLRLYGYDPSVRHQFYFIHSFLLLSKEHINSGKIH